MTIPIEDSLETLDFENAADNAEQRAEAGVRKRIDAVKAGFGLGRRQEGDLRLKVETERSNGASR